MTQAYFSAGEKRQSVDADTDGRVPRAQDFVPERQAIKGPATQVLNLTLNFVPGGL
jgi:hypothetical protein